MHSCGAEKIVENLKEIKMVIAVASGKGGTGKTTISVGMASYLNKKGKSVNILDCDVEEPNVNLFIKADISVQETVYKPIPGVIKERCDRCGKCEEICQFNCILVTPEGPLIFPDMCHSCGGCRLVCPPGAIIDEMRELGTVEEGYYENIRYIGGRLNVSEAMSPPLIESVKKHIADEEVNIIDAPPGTSCPVIESIKDSDYVIMVTEPTPFGLNDLMLGVEMVREVGIPHGIVINRSDIGDGEVRKYCREQGIEILAEIPNSMELAKKYADGDFMDFLINEFETDISNIISRSSCNSIAGV